MASGPSEFSWPALLGLRVVDSLAVAITIGLGFGLRLPTLSFTILCNNVATLSGVSWFSRKPLPRIALENQLKGALMGLKNHLMKSTTVSINRE